MNRQIPDLDDHAVAEMRKFLDEDLIVAAGFSSYRLMGIPGADKAEIERARRAFYAGIQYMIWTMHSCAGREEFQEHMNLITDELYRYFHGN